MLMVEKDNSLRHGTILLIHASHVDVIQSLVFHVMNMPVAFLYVSHLPCSFIQKILAAQAAVSIGVRTKLYLNGVFSDPDPKDKSMELIVLIAYKLCYMCVHFLL